MEESYHEYADAVQAATGIDNDAIVASQAVAQTYLGQTEITKELTFAIADLSASMGGDLNGAAEKIGRTIGTNTNAFAKQGLVISETASEAERMAKVLEFVQLKAGGLAAEFNKADGYTQALATAFGNLQEAIGSNFAPIFSDVRKALSEFLTTVSKNQVLTQLAAVFIAVGAGLTGIVAIAAVAIPAFAALAAAATAVGLSMTVAFVGIPLVIGAIIAGVTLLALNWNQAMAGMKAAAAGAVTLISELFNGLGKILSGALSLDRSKIAEGLAQIQESCKKAKDEAVTTYTEITAVQKEEEAKQNADKKAAADAKEAQERQHQANLRAIRLAETQLVKLQNENASADLIALKQKEIEVLKALDQQKSKEELDLLREKRDKIRTLQEEQQIEDQERDIAFAQLQAETKAELTEQGIAVDAQVREDRLAQIKATAQTEADVDRQLQETLLKQKIDQRNQEILDRKKYGVAVATLNKALNSDEVQGTKSAAGELVQLQQSKNATLKTIGKVAAVANITIATAESAMNIFRGFSTIPIVGPALGIAGAAAAVAFGAERIGAVTSAATGGLITGGIPGRDSVPALLEPGELVVPKKNFNEVVGAVQGDSKSMADEEMLNLLRSIDNKFSAPTQTVIQGDVLADESFVDSFCRRISDAIEFRNVQIVGVNT